ncbi:hypothetical protein HYH02_008871 [Chlamydomonas schloesseri]|uniref:Uncharacterized protein n=1 Tax=Chlamydomonas schloesseri TaxID=2026947 RepID=A0A835WCR8_9CHLO|nr:hypothetical protein HYH02_008871 [Chlamydomonas schloesseri]|eukprot:KAG2445001.1 hypothetical protein HYH02_008871 [Chlamydomonas schloesseri]
MQARLNRSTGTCFLHTLLPLARFPAATTLHTGLLNQDDIVRHEEGLSGCGGLALPYEDDPQAAERQVAQLYTVIAGGGLNLAGLSPPVLYTGNAVSALDVLSRCTKLRSPDVLTDREGQDGYGQTMGLSTTDGPPLTDAAVSALAQLREAGFLASASPFLVEFDEPAGKGKGVPGARMALVDADLDGRAYEDVRKEADLDVEGHGEGVDGASTRLLAGVLAAALAELPPGPQRRVGELRLPTLDLPEGWTCRRARPAGGPDLLAGLCEHCDRVVCRGSIIITQLQAEYVTGSLDALLAAAGLPQQLRLMHGTWHQPEAQEQQMGTAGAVGLLPLTTPAPGGSNSSSTAGAAELALESATAAEALPDPPADLGPGAKRQWLRDLLLQHCGGATALSSAAARCLRFEGVAILPAAHAVLLEYASGTDAAALMSAVAASEGRVLSAAVVLVSRLGAPVALDRAVWELWCGPEEEAARCQAAEQAQAWIDSDDEEEGEEEEEEEEEGEEEEEEEEEGIHWSPDPPRAGAPTRA